VASREAAIEALTGAPAGRVFSCEIFAFRVPTSFNKAEGNIEGRGIARGPENPAQSDTPACRETPRARTERLHRRPCKHGRSEKAMSHRYDMHVAVSGA
jgi:hypothetical protein